LQACLESLMHGHCMLNRQAKQRVQSSMQEWANRESAQLHGEMGPPLQLHLIKVISFADLPNRQVFPPRKVRRPTHMRALYHEFGMSMGASLHDDVHRIRRLGARIPLCIHLRWLRSLRRQLLRLFKTAISPHYISQICHPLYSNSSI
jgi:hypothetical protein